MLGVLAFLPQLAAALPIAEGPLGGELAPAQLNVLHRLFDGELKWFEVGALVAAVAEGLLETHAAAAPPVDLIVDLGMLDQDWPSEGRDRLHGLIGPLPVELPLDLSMRLDLEVRLVVLAEWLGGVLRADHPGLRRDLLDLLEVIASGPQQHNYYLI